MARCSLYEGQRCRRGVFGAFGAHGGVGSAVSKQYNRGIKARGAAAKERSVRTGGCVRQFRSSTLEVVPRSVGRDGKGRGMWSVRC